MCFKILTDDGIYKTLNYKKIIMSIKVSYQLSEIFLLEDI